MRSTRVAAIDCGTNSIRLLICDIDGPEKTDLVREMRVVRLGEGVDTTRRLAPAALERTFAAIAEYRDLIAAHDVQVIRFCATSASRDAENAAEFVAGVQERLGVKPEVLTGSAEAEATFLGAARAFRGAYPALVIDIGGGSTELVVGDGSGVLSAESLNMGAVRMTERHLADDPPSSEQIAACVADVDAVLDTGRVDLASAATVVGVAGTMTTIAAHVLALPAYDSARIHQAVLPWPAVREAAGDLVRASVAKRRALPYMHPGRADVIGAGAIICERVLRRTRAEALVVSESDILDGIAWGAV